MTDNPFHRKALAWGQVDISAKAKRRRIREDAKTAVLDRIRHAAAFPKRSTDARLIGRDLS